MQINSILINLPKRKERLEKSTKEITNFFGEFKTIVSKGVDFIENTTLAVREAHKNCIKFSKEAGFNTVIVIEDDITLKENSKPYFDELMENLPDDYDVCVFGIYGGKINVLENQYWNKINKFSGLHFYLVNQKAYDKILEYNGTQPIDHWIGQNLNCYISKKLFAFQLDGWSDNAKTITDYNKTVLPGYKEFMF